MQVADLELDLEVFSGPFDLLLTLVLREEVDLMEVELADVVLAYIDVLEARGDLDLETATEFLVLVAALLELKSRLLLPSEADDLLDLEPHEAAEELLARLLDAHRYRNAADHLSELLERESGHRHRRAPLPRSLRRTDPAAAGAVYKPTQLGKALGGLLREPPQLDLRHLNLPKVSVAERLQHLRALLRRGALHVRRGRPGCGSRDRRGHPLRAARALQARRGGLEPGRPVRRDHDRAPRRRRARRRMSALARIVEALLFLSPEPVALADLAAACEASPEEVGEAIGELEAALDRARDRAAAASPAATRWRPIRWPRTPHGGCWPSRAPRR